MADDSFVGISDEGIATGSIDPSNFPPDNAYTPATISAPFDATQAAKDFILNAATGHVTQGQVDSIAKQTSQDVLAAGGTQQEADAAANEIRNYNANQQGGTAEQVATSTLKWTGGTILVVIILALLVLGAKEFREL